MARDGNDFGAYSGDGLALGHPTPTIERMAKRAPRLPVAVTWQALRRAGVLYYWPYSDTIDLINRSGSRRSKLSAQRDSHDCRVLQEEWVFDAFLREVALGRKTRGLSDRTRLR